MVRKTKEEAQETKKAIIEAAVAVFVEQGVSKASLEEIAERAGVTRGAVYWHFKNKGDIFRALHEELHTSFMEIVLADLEIDHPQPLLQLEQLCLRFLQDIQHDSMLRDIKTIFYLKCDYSGDMADVLCRMNDSKSQCTPIFSRYFEKAQQKGHIEKTADPKTMTQALCCYMSGIMSEYLRNPDSINISEQAAPLIRHFFKGLEVSAT